MMMGHKDCQHQTMSGLPPSYSRQEGLEVMVEQNKYVTFFFHMDEKYDIDMRLNKVIVPKYKQDSYGSKDYLNAKFDVASHSVATMARLIAEMKPSINIYKKSLLGKLQS